MSGGRKTGAAYAERQLQLSGTLVWRGQSLLATRLRTAARPRRPVPEVRPDLALAQVLETDACALRTGRCGTKVWGPQRVSASASTDRSLTTLSRSAAPGRCRSTRRADRRCAHEPAGHTKTHDQPSIRNMGLATTQILASLFDGITRHSPEDRWFQQVAATSGFRKRSCGAIPGATYPKAGSMHLTIPGQADRGTARAVWVRWRGRSLAATADGELRSGWATEASRSTPPVR